MTVSIRDSDGTTRLEGDLLASGGATGDVLTQQADGTYAAAPGGSQPITRAEYDLTLDGSDISWAFGFGDALLDLTDPKNPTPVVSGVYSVAVYLTFAGVTGSPAMFGFSLVLDNDDFGANIETRVEGAGGRVTATLPFYWPAGSPGQIVRFFSDGTPTTSGRAWVQRLS